MILYVEIFYDIDALGFVDEIRSINAGTYNNYLINHSLGLHTNT